MTADEMKKYVKEAEDETGVKFTVSLAEDGALMIHADGVSAHAASPMDGNNALTALLSCFHPFRLQKARQRHCMHGSQRFRSS